MLWSKQNPGACITLVYTENCSVKTYVWLAIPSFALLVVETPENSILPEKSYVTPAAFCPAFFRMDGFL